MKEQRNNERKEKKKKEIQFDALPTLLRRQESFKSIKLR